MTERQYNSLKKKLLQGDRQAHRAILDDAEASEKAANDLDIIRYLDQQEDIVDYLDGVLTEQEQESLNAAWSTIADAYNRIAEIGEQLGSKFVGIANSITEMLDPVFAVANIIGNSEFWEQASKAWKEAEPYMEEILSRPEYANLTAHQLLVEKHIDENGKEYTIFQKVREEIREREEKERALPATIPGAKGKALLPGSANLRKLLQAKDAPNMISIKGSDMLWNLTKEELAITNNQFSFLPLLFQKYGAEYGAGDDTYITIAFNFDEVEEPFSSFSQKYRAVHDATENLRRKGYRRVTLEDIFNNSALSKGKPAESSDLKFIYEALKVLRSIKVLYDSSHDYKSYQKKQGDFVIREGRLLDIQGFDYAFSDKQLKSIIVLLGDMPAPIFNAAIIKGQSYTIPKKVVQTPLQKNDNMLKLQSYMIESIEFMKDPKKPRSREILIETMLNRLGKPGDRKYKERLITKPGYLVTLLDYWKDIKYIKGYEITWDRIIIKINKTTPQISQKA